MLTPNNGCEYDIVDMRDKTSMTPNLIKTFAFPSPRNLTVTHLIALESIMQRIKNISYNEKKQF